MNLVQPKLVQGLVILVSVASVAVADIFLKKAAMQSSLKAVMGSPWLICAIGLYLLQIGLFTLAFFAGWKLSIVGALQTAIYALVVLAAGVLLYQESLTRLQLVGICLAVSGVLLINWR